MHADGLLKNEEIYNIFDIELENKVNKNIPGIKELYDSIHQQYIDGRTIAIPEDEIMILAIEFMPHVVMCEYPKRYELTPKE